jgi:hypothetical protein
MEICKECGGRYYDKPDGGKLPLDQMFEVELHFLRISAELKDIKKEELPETGKCQTPKE